MIEPFVTLFGITLLEFVTFRVWARYVTRVNDSSQETNRILLASFVTGAVIAWVITIASLLGTGSLEDTRRVLSVVGVGAYPGAEFLAWLPTLAGAIVPIVGAYLGVFPYTSAGMDPDVSRRNAVEYVVRVATVLSGLFVLSALTTVVLSSSLTGVLSPYGAQFAAGLVLLVLYGVCWYAGTPLWYRLTERSVPMDGSTRLGDVVENVGLSVNRIELVPRAAYKLNPRVPFNYHAASVRGPPSYRWLFVTGKLHEEASKETYRALLAVLAGMEQRHVREFDVTTLLAIVTALTLGIPAIAVGVLPYGSSVGQFVVLVAVTTGFIIGRLTIGRRLVFEADRIAADTTSPKHVREALEWLLEADVEPPSRGPFGRLLMIPSATRRIEELDTVRSGSGTEDGVGDTTTE
ncbi:hypothetical protein [Halosolutus halophilus]|uniref:hypothetical protein n=1 Tax=Halosolutus halophilus TaxID=1552990 RepID=UPI0022351664|nr:hypothetical protein [Halosolutus halophilus]